MGIIEIRVCDNAINMRRVYMIKQPFVVRWAGGVIQGPWPGADWVSRPRGRREPIAARPEPRTPRPAGRPVRAPIQHRIPNIYQYVLTKCYYSNTCYKLYYIFVTRFR